MRDIKRLELTLRVYATPLAEYRRPQLWRTPDRRSLVAAAFGFVVTFGW